MTLERREGILYPQNEAIRGWVTGGKGLGPSSQQDLTPSSASRWLCGLGHFLTSLAAVSSSEEMKVMVFPVLTSQGCVRINAERNE